MPLSDEPTATETMTATSSKSTTSTTTITTTGNTMLPVLGLSDHNDPALHNRLRTKLEAYQSQKITKNGLHESFDQDNHP